MLQNLLNCIAMSSRQLPASKALCDSVAAQIMEVETLVAPSTFTVTDGVVTVTAGIDSVGSTYCNVTGLAQ